MYALMTADCRQRRKANRKSFRFNSTDSSDIRFASSMTDDVASVQSAAYTTQPPDPDAASSPFLQTLDERSDEEPPPHVTTIDSTSAARRWPFRPRACASASTSGTSASASFGELPVPDQQPEVQTSSGCTPPGGRSALFRHVISRHRVEPVCDEFGPFYAGSDVTSGRAQGGADDETNGSCSVFESEAPTYESATGDGGTCHVHCHVTNRETAAPTLAKKVSFHVSDEDLNLAPVQTTGGDAENPWIALSSTDGSSGPEVGGGGLLAGSDDTEKRKRKRSWFRKGKKAHTKATSPHDNGV